MPRLSRLLCFAAFTPLLVGCSTMAAAGEPGNGQAEALVRVLDLADANHDGRITRAEFQDARMRLFARLDHNGDGYIDKSDASGLPMRRHKLEEVISGMVNRLDKDGDGRVSREEFQNAPTLIFDRVDTNHDGVIDAQELAAFHAQVGNR